MVRSATPEDLPVILDLIRELAVYEHEPDIVEATEEMLGSALFGTSPIARAELVEHAGPNGPEVAGMAVWYVTFSTWTGRGGVYLEDLVVRERYRKHGYGKALMRRLAEIAVANGYARFEWSVLDWNQPSIDFYVALGAQPVGGWTRYRLEGEGLRGTAELA